MLKMAMSGPDGVLSKWSLSRMESSCSDFELPALSELGLHESIQDVTLQTTAKSLSKFYLKFVHAKMGTVSSHLKDDVVSSLAYTAGLCVTKQFVTELISELVTMGHSPQHSVLQQESDNQHMQHHECNDELSNLRPPLKETPSVTVDETVKLEVNEDSVLKEDTKIEADGSNIVRESRASPHRRHGYYLTKNVPPTYALCMRGVTCIVCGEIFKGLTCVKDLSYHVKKVHKKKATARFLKKIREENTIEKIVGSGMKWCECSTCIFLAKSHGWIR